MLEVGEIESENNWKENPKKECISVSLQLELTRCGSLFV